MSGHNHVPYAAGDNLHICVDRRTNWKKCSFEFVPRYTYAHCRFRALLGLAVGSERDGGRCPQIY